MRRSLLRFKSGAGFVLSVSQTKAEEDFVGFNFDLHYYFHMETVDKALRIAAC